MNEKDFVYWLQGFVEIQDSDVVNEKQWSIIKDHLKLVFDKKTPQYGLNQVTVGRSSELRLEDVIGKQNNIFQPQSWPLNTQITC